MNRLIQIVNFVGVLALSVVCVLQWGRIGVAAAEARRYAAESAGRAATITARDRTIREDAADLNELRQRLIVVDGQLKSLQADRDAARRRSKSKPATIYWSDRPPPSKRSPPTATPPRRSSTTWRPAITRW